MTVMSSIHRLTKTSASTDGVIRKLKATPNIAGTPEPETMLSDACKSNRMIVPR